MPTHRDVIAEYHGNYMTRPERGSGIRHDDEDEPEEQERSELFEFVVAIARADWARIKAEKGD